MNRTKLFFDTEFTGLHQKTTLISIGIVAESGETFYAELNDYDKTQINPWLQEHVIGNLILKQGETKSTPNNSKTAYSETLTGSTKLLQAELKMWLEQFGSVEMWSDCLAYDWVLFNNIFGDAFSLPENVYYIPMDICTYMKIAGVDPDVNREEFAEKWLCKPDESDVSVHLKKHNALWDAHVIWACYSKLATMDEYNKSLK